MGFLQDGHRVMTGGEVIVIPLQPDPRSSRHLLRSSH